MEYLTKANNKDSLDKIIKIIEDNFNNPNWSPEQSIAASNFLPSEDKEHASKNRTYFMLSILSAVIITGLSSEIDDTFKLGEVIQKLNEKGTEFLVNKPCAQSVVQQSQDALEQDEHTSEHNP